MAKLEEEIMKTILGMKRVINGDQDSSGSEEPYLQPSNRGNKLKRKANYVQDGQRGRTRGPKIYKATIEHAGYRRNILKRVPKRYDQDGIELSSSDEDEEADAQAAEEYPYAEIRLEHLLIPLVSAASLPEHPSLSSAYTSPMLTEMAQQSYEMVQRERKSLNNAKQLLTKFRGDETWIPCGLLYSEDDERIFDTTKLFPKTLPSSTSQVSNGYAVHSTMNGAPTRNPHLELRDGSKHEIDLETVIQIANNSTHDHAAEPSNNANHTSANGVLRSDTPTGVASAGMVHTDTGNEHHIEMADSKVQNTANHDSTSEDIYNADKATEDEVYEIVGPDVSMTGQVEPVNDLNQGLEFSPPNGVDGANGTKHRRQSAGEGGGKEPLSLADTGDALDVREVDKENLGDEGGSRPRPRRMQTRAQAQAVSEPAASSRTETPDAWVPPEIHPLFLIPARAIPDKNCGLSPNEAEEIRRQLVPYVQKQEEVVRGAEKLYEGLMQAERQRKTVFKWCKAEGHLGEMSDGEDWYDKDEWGLEDSLRKGHNDEEEDTAVAGKKTRGRRA
ncbi:hypothetical protein P7C71_g4622, partial [Lecanoromycetidae sp. Uapishka_2]